MTIDLERPITFNEASQFLQRNSRPAYSTWWRWWRRGVKGIRLRTIVVGGRRYTTAEAVQEFIAKVTAVANGDRPPSRTPRQREREIARAEKDLEDLGVHQIRGPPNRPNAGRGKQVRNRRLSQRDKMLKKPTVHGRTNVMLDELRSALTSDMLVGPLVWLDEVIERVLGRRLGRRLSPVLSGDFAGASRTRVAAAIAVSTKDAGMSEHEVLWPRVEKRRLKDLPDFPFQRFHFPEPASCPRQFIWLQPPVRVRLRSLR